MARKNNLFAYEHSMTNKTRRKLLKKGIITKNSLYPFGYFFDIQNTNKYKFGK